MDIFSYGNPFARSSLIIDENLFSYTGTNLVLFNLRTMEREMVYQYNSTSISALARNSNYIFSVCNRGEIAVIDIKNFKLLGKFLAGSQSLQHADANDDYLIVSSKLTVIIFDLKDFAKNKFIPKKCDELVGLHRESTIFKDNTIFSVLTEQINETQCNYYLTKYNVNTKKFSKSAIKNIQDIKVVNVSKEGLAVITYKNNKAIIFDADTLEFFTDTEFPVAGTFKAVSILENSVFLTIKKNITLEIVVEKNMKFPSKIALDDKMFKIPHLKIHQTQRKGIHLWTKPFEEGIGLHDSNIQLINTKKGVIKEISCFSLSCCGVSLSPNGKLVAVGDLSGTISVHSTKKEKSITPVRKLCLEESIRTILFDTESQSVMIGTLDGKLLRWFLNTTQPDLIATFDHGVMNLKFNKKKDGNNLLLVGLGSGECAIFSESSECQALECIQIFLAHAPKDNACDKFPTIDMYAEIWSTTWCPSSNDRWSTASEDQACLIWDNSKDELQLLAKLKGHTRAVTSIDWEIMDPRLGEIFVSCSDDQTIRIYDAKNKFKLLDVVSTNFVQEWHTLTYLCLEKGGTRLAVSSLNGYVFIYDILNKSFEFVEKIHQGSIEGLDWKGKHIATCSGDNVLNIITPEEGTTMMEEIK